MEQYYAVANLDKSETLRQHDFGGGLKLTETCYVGNHFTDALTYLLANDWHGDKVVFCGDYAWEALESEAREKSLADKDPYAAAEHFKDRGVDFTGARGAETSKEMPDGRCIWVPLEGSFEIDPPTYRYLINETLGVFCDREEAPVAWIGWWKGEPVITRTDPLTLFMAIGNGLGGGDYRGAQDDPAPNMGLVGSWAGHVISASDEEPQGMEKIECPFDETGLFVTAPDDAIKLAMAESHLDWAHTSLSELAEALDKPTSLESVASAARAARDGLHGHGLEETPEIEVR